LEFTFLGAASPESRRMIGARDAIATVALIAVLPKRMRRQE
jgi:hypothetical protein